uniref:Uncharacterized protein n=1 Tax=Meloidogyne enterolobii TaxID=390850 RepID=A0A6V7XIP9_MELEN|nr:unnamed protein product [Meloidogyne enterolobii]
MNILRNSQIICISFERAFELSLILIIISYVINIITRARIFRH